MSVTLIKQVSFIFHLRKTSGHVECKREIEKKGTHFFFHFQEGTSLFPFVLFFFFLIFFFVKIKKKKNQVCEINTCQGRNQVQSAFFFFNYFCFLDLILLLGRVMFVLQLSLLRFSPELRVRSCLFFAVQSIL